MPDERPIVEHSCPICGEHRWKWNGRHYECSNPDCLDKRCEATDDLGRRCELPKGHDLTHNITIRRGNGSSWWDPIW